MKLGASTGNLITKDPFKVIRTLAKEFEHIEILDEFPFSLPVLEDHLSDLKILSKEFGVKFNIHAPFSFINLGHSEDAYRELSTKILIKSLNLVNKLNGEYVNFHLGSLKYIRGNFQGDKDIIEMHLKRSFIELKKIVKHAENLGLILCIETELPRGKEKLFIKPEVFKRIFKEIPSDNFGLTLDTTHSYYVGREKLLIQFIDEFKNELEVVHASDGKFENGNYATHLEIGDGEIDWKALFKKLKEVGFKKSIVVETGWGSFKKSKDYLLSNFSENFR